jgi:hypothetical protein
MQLDNGQYGVGGGAAGKMMHVWIVGIIWRQQMAM